MILVDIGGGQIGDVKKNGERIATIGVAHGRISAANAEIKAAHMPIDGHCFFPRQTNKSVDDIDRFFAVSEGQNFLPRRIGPLNPHSVFLDVAKVLFIKIDFAHVVQQAANRNRFARNFFFPLFTVFPLYEGE